jgi:hypothetical protein
MTTKEARGLAVAGMPNEAKGRGVTIELDREQSGCAICHAYGIGATAPQFFTVTLGWWSVDLRTGEVWDELRGHRHSVLRAVYKVTRDLPGRLRLWAGLLPYLPSSGFSSSLCLDW